MVKNYNRSRDTMRMCRACSDRRVSLAGRWAGTLQAEAGTAAVAGGCNRLAVVRTSPGVSSSGGGTQGQPAASERE